jgi:hypothetical protein
VNHTDRSGFGETWGDCHDGSGDWCRYDVPADEDITVWGPGPHGGDGAGGTSDGTRPPGNGCIHATMAGGAQNCRDNNGRDGNANVPCTGPSCPEPDSPVTPPAPPVPPPPSRPAPRQSSGVAAGLGIGFFGFWAQVTGVAGGVDVKAVLDSEGNLGTLVCAAGGLAVGVGGGGGVAVTGTFATGTIFDMEGLSGQVEAGGGHGLLAKGSAGGWMGSKSLGVHGSRGVGGGEGGYVSAQAVGCKVLLSTKVW